jgi:hypothetical protein
MDQTGKVQIPRTIEVNGLETHNKFPDWNPIRISPYKHL